MLASENVYTAKQGSSAAENIAEWAAHNPRLARILTWAEKARAEIDTDGE